MRFQDVDRNNDGVITRSEWRGNNQSFSNEDWNGDGILSGDEVSPGASRPGNLASSDQTASRFHDLDYNQDGVISRNEWRGDRMAFDRWDSNRNGVLNRDEFLSSNTTIASSFADLDRNHDAVISRSEWNDDRRSFDALDANRDNLLGSDEFLGRSSNDAVASFNDLDVNRDGRITRNEWSSERRTFDRLDVNHDAVLTRDEFSERVNNDRAASFLELDVNGDGNVARSEWRGSVREFDSVDANRDGVLSRDELQGLVNDRPYTNLRGGTMIISRGSEFSIRTNETIDSKSAAVGQQFSALIERDILDNTGKLAIPKGSEARLVIRQTDAGGVTNGSELILDIDSIRANGTRYLVSTEALQEQSREGLGTNRRTGVMVGGGAGLGALIGAIAGGGKGAAIGAGVGAVAGAAGQVLTKGGQVKVPAESVLTFKLDQDLHVEPAR